MIGVLGGTFDPVHHGHLRLAVELVEGLGLRALHLVPARTPPHRGPPRASAEDRLAMLQAAIAGTPRLVADPRELDRPGPSYTVDTLASLRAEVGEEPIWLGVGVDAFRALDTWHRWRALCELAHLAVARRPAGRLPSTGEVARLLEERRVRTVAAAAPRPAGAILVVEVPGLAISSTRIRALIRSGRDPRWLLPDPVLAIIHQRGLYGARP
jgi:nicotinate-nucleotide adenylyltransferase